MAQKKELFKCALQEYGALCVMITGEQMMQKLYADSLVLVEMVSI